MLIKFLFVDTPIYPHWLDFRNLDRGNEELFTYVKGDVLETGCGNAEVKTALLKKYPKRITSYLATDYSSWDDIFEVQTRKMKKLGLISQTLYGKGKVREKIDMVADALKLPFEGKSFDTYCSFEVLEHINYPSQFFTEASRVLRKGGKLLVSVPFLYREHSEGTGYDYHRFTVSALKQYCEDNGLKVDRIFTYSFFGTAHAALVNQYVIRKIAEGNILLKLILFLLSPLIFLFNNIVGFFIDAIDQDERFAAHYHIVATKK